MSSIITRFDDLSPEVILCVLDHLSTTDRYKSFFDYDDRLRVLVKKRTEFSRKDLNADILRYSTLHSWYKNLTFIDGGRLSFIVPQQGQQPRYSFDPRVTDSNGLHWWFMNGDSATSIVNDQVREIIMRHPFRLNPFFYHMEYTYRSSDDSSSSRCFDGADIIVSRAKSTIGPWLNINYPEYADKISVHLHDDYSPERPDSVFTCIFDGEWLKATTAITKVAIQIWNELKELNDINPLDTQFRNQLSF